MRQDVHLPDLIFDAEEFVEDQHDSIVELFETGHANIELNGARYDIVLKVTEDK